MATERTRDGNGKFRRTLNTAAREARAAELFSRGLSYRAIAREMGIDVKHAHGHVQDAMLAVVETPGRAALQMQLARLERLYEVANAVLEREHVTVSHGHVITQRDPETGEDTPLLDDGPVLQAIDRMGRILDSIAKLQGLYAAVKLDATVHEVKPEDIELAELIRETQAKNALTEQRVKGTTDGD